jgi:pimeloyl-ACP methyl ester carboxylesterase
MNRRIAASTPVRVLWGEGDPYLPVENAQRFAAVNVDIMRGVGHWPPIVAAGRVAAAIAPFAQAWMRENARLAPSMKRVVTIPSTA